LRPGTPGVTPATRAAPGIPVEYRRSWGW